MELWIMRVRMATNEQRATRNKKRAPTADGLQMGVRERQRHVSHVQHETIGLPNVG